MKTNRITVRRSDDPIVDLSLNYEIILNGEVMQKHRVSVAMLLLPQSNMIRVAEQLEEGAARCAAGNRLGEDYAVFWEGYTSEPYESLPVDI